MKTKQNLKPCLSISAIESNIEHLEPLWLKPAEVSIMIGFDEKWLAAAREGRKGLVGPPFRKIGSGKTSPIRYPVDKLIIWMDSFPLQGVTTSQFSSFATFQHAGSVSDVWPFVLYDDGTMDEIFRSINSGKFAEQYRTRQIIWLANSSIPQQD